jgi:hypothetical protein
MVERGSIVSSAHKGQLWVQPRGRWFAAFVEIWRRPNGVLEVMPYNDYHRPETPCLQVFDIPMSELILATKNGDTISLSE